MKHQIIKLLRWTELEYAEFQYNTGIDYLNAYIPNDAQGIDMLCRNKIYWSWWKNHWAIRDQEFLEIAANGGDLKAVLRLYMRFHNTRRLINEIYPNAQVLGNSYCRMIGRLQDAK